MDSVESAGKRPLDTEVVSEEGNKNEEIFKKQKLDNDTSNDEKLGISEIDVGITEYLYANKEDRIIGTLKQRYTDFLVNEIDLNGNVVHLTDEGFKPKELTEEEKMNLKLQQDKLKNDELLHNDNKISDEDFKKLNQYFDESEINDIISLLNDGTKTVELKKVFNDKEERTKIHQLIREISNNKIESVTTSVNTFIFGRNANSKRRRNNKNKVNVNIEHNLGERKNYLHFSLYKENKETMEVASILAKFLKTQVKFIKYAGTKDRRGVTVQRMSIERFTVERVTTLNNALKGCKLGCFEYKDIPIKLGDLKGNEFIITIKDIEALNSGKSIEDTILPILKSLKEKGFINYFGMQRFGTFSISTHEIGKEILKNNWKEASELILSEQKVAIPGSFEARKIWKETKNPKEALKKMPRKCNAEYSILSRLERCEKEEDGEFNSNSYFNAIMGIPRNLRIMYGHAYQSYIWNLVASKRIQLFGLKVVVGDLVLTNNEKILDEFNKSIKEDYVDKENDEEVLIQDFKEVNGLKARPITEEEVKSNKFDIYDIVLPTPGFDVVYPENSELRQVYIDIMKKDELDPFNMTRKVREFSLSGSYRSVVSKIDNLEYYFRKYNKVTDQLVLTDYEILKRKQKQEQEQSDEKIEQILPGYENGEKTALILKLQLGVSTYATMALRELLQGDTSRFGGVVNLKE